MAIACPVDLDTSTLRSEISNIYERVAMEPTAEYHFHRGLRYAAEFLGYDATELANLPPGCAGFFRGRRQSPGNRSSLWRRDSCGHRLRRRHGSSAGGQQSRRGGP